MLPKRLARIHGIGPWTRIGGGEAGTMSRRMKNRSVSECVSDMGRA
jgi:hypothetical protein